MLGLLIRRVVMVFTFDFSFSFFPFQLPVTEDMKIWFQRFWQWNTHVVTFLYNIISSFCIINIKTLMKPHFSTVKALCG